MYNQFIDEDSNEKQVMLLIDLGFPEPIARAVVLRYPNTQSLEELIERALEQSPPPQNQEIQHKCSLIQFSELSVHSIKNPQISIPIDNIILAPVCGVCFQDTHIWISYTCGHKFCKSCVVKFVKMNKVQRIDESICLQLGCNAHIRAEEVRMLESQVSMQELRPIVDNGPICVRCRLPMVAHKFSWFQNSCEQAEYDILRSCMRQDEDGNVVQRCPQCGIWVQKVHGCNSVQCSYCKRTWCWLCRRLCDMNHYKIMNPMGCPGLGAAEFTLDQWPWHKICWKRVKAVVYFLLLYLLCLLVYPFFVGYILIRRWNPPIDGNACYKLVIFMGIFILWVIISVLAVFPGIPIFLVSKRAREYVFNIESV